MKIIIQVYTTMKRKSSRQQSFFLFGFKMFASEKMPDKIKSKGFSGKNNTIKSSYQVILNMTFQKL